MINKKSIPNLHQRFQYALKLLKKQATYQEALILLTDIDVILKSERAIPDSTDKIVL